jgi:hypothetical protein
MSAQGLSNPRNSGSYLPQAMIQGSSTVGGTYPPPTNLTIATTRMILDDGFFLVPGDLTALGIRDSGRYELTLIIFASAATFGDILIEGGPNGAFNLVSRQSSTLFGVNPRYEFTDYFDCVAGDIWRFRCYEEAGSQTLTLTVIMTRIG